jgi:hypothetical protein
MASRNVVHATIFACGIIKAYPGVSLYLPLRFVLFVADLLPPVDGVAVERFHNRCALAVENNRKRISGSSERNSSGDKYK